MTLKSMTSISLIVLLFIACSKSSGDNKTYSCTCHYKAFPSGKDTIYFYTYPANIGQAAAQADCDTNITPAIKVIDTAGNCSL